MLKFIQPTLLNSANITTSDARSKKTGVRRDIQFLRAFAVIAVIGYHFNFYGFNGGFIGVDLFFVISGYLIFGQIHARLAKKTFSLKDFSEARLRRIFPALFVLCTVTTAYTWFTSLPRDYMAYARTAISALAFVSNYAFMATQGYFDAAANTKPLLHTWSLSVEGQFYFWLPLLLLVIGTRARIPLQAWLIAGLITSCAISLWLVYQTPESGFYRLSARAWEFLAGALLSFYCIKNCRLKFRSSHFLACLLSLLSSVFLLNNHLAWPGLWTLIPVTCAACFIFLGESAQEHVLLRIPVFQTIGDMSYSLYLWHWPIWVFALQLQTSETQDLPLDQKLALLLITFAAAYVSWRWIERPFRDRHYLTRQQFSLIISLAMLAALAFTAGILITKGYPPRFPSYVARAAEQAAQTTPRNECFRSGDNTKKFVGQFCTFGASVPATKADTLLWGDSHANQYLTPLTDASKKLQITGLIATMSGCRAFKETDTAHATDFPHCKDFNREIYAYLLAHTEIKTIILGRIWFDGEETLEHTAALVRDLIAHGRKVILIGPLPLPGMHVEHDWAMRQIQAGKAIDEIRLNNLPAVSQAHIYTRLQEKLAAATRSGQLFWIDPSQKFCDRHYCYVVQNGQANFRDTSHITQIASHKFEADFYQALKQSHTTGDQ